MGQSNTVWIKIWSGNWSLLSCSYFGDQFTRTIREALGERFEKALFISHEGLTQGYLERSDTERFGRALAAQAVADKNTAMHWAEDTIQQADSLLAAIRSYDGITIDRPAYDRFLEGLYAYAPSPRPIKFASDYLPPQLLDELLPRFSEARVHSEPVYVETESFMERFARQLEESTDIPWQHILTHTREEFEAFLAGGDTVSPTELAKRFESGALLFENGTERVLRGDEVDALERDIQQAHARQVEILGVPAYSGKASGRVRVIVDPKPDTDFDEGDVLVTGMTRPEYLHLVKRSAAFVTDAGGMLSHAAITARELKKPCIVGTQIGTKALKDGDLVEVDADAGVVRIIS